jgi:hypothetical protein
MHNNLQSFFDNTKHIQLLLSVTLFLIIITMVLPHSLASIKMFGQVLIIVLLSYILFKNFIETRLLAAASATGSTDKDQDKNQDRDITSNVLASYILNAFIMMLLLYCVYLLF